jgi:HK97 family phage prohead protease
MVNEMAMHRREAAGKRAGSLSFVLSDATRDRMGDIIEPSGWQLDWFRRNPVALFNHQTDFPIGRWRNPRVEGEQLVADLEPAEAGTSARIDEIISLIRQDILPATSVGFRPLKREPIDPEYPGRGTRFLETELLEASIVSVPANPAALHVARSMHISEETIRLAFGELAATGPGGRRGELADPTLAPATRAPPRITPTMNIGQKIQAVQERLNASRDALTEYLAQEHQDRSQRDAMAGEVDALQEELASLEVAEKALAPRVPAQQAAATTVTAPAINRRPLGLPKRELEGVDYWARAGAISLQHHVTRKPIEEILRDWYPDDETTQWVTRAAQPGASTTLATWAAELVQTTSRDFLTPLTPGRILPGLSAAGTALNFGPDGWVIKIPSTATTPSIAGSFVGEAQPIPVRRMGFTSIELRPHKVGVITRYSREIAEASSPSIEGIVRGEIIRTTNIVLDTLVIDAVAGTATRPAGLLNGVAALTATAGGGYGAVLGDIGKLTAPFYTVNAGANLVMLMNPAQRRALGLVPGPGNMGIGWTGALTQGITLIDSTTVPAGTVIMVEGDDFVSAIGTPEFMVSEEATLHIEDTTPTHINPGTPASPVESMFQTNQLALRLIMPVTWAMRRTGMVQWMAGVNWAPA